MPDYLPRAELDAIARRHGTDKGGQGHDYMRFYEFFLKPFKEQRFTLLELGVGPAHNKGKSLLTWREYFPHVKIVGADIRVDALEIESERIRIEIGNCGSERFLRRLARKYSPTVIVDDASHKWSHQIRALEVLFPALQPGGLYILEDIQTSFEPLREKQYADCETDAFTYLMQLTQLVAGDGRAHPSIDRSRLTESQLGLADKIDTIVYFRTTAILIKESGTLKRRGLQLFKAVGSNTDDES